MSERLQKLLSRHGFGSRREVERWIIEGRVLLNGKSAQLGDQFEPGDRLMVDGKDLTSRLSIEAPIQALIYHKPQGQALARKDPNTIDQEEGEEPAYDNTQSDEMDLVVERLPATRGSRWIAINPMHPGDSGLLLFTNDGTLGYALTRRKRWISAVYMVRVLAPGAIESPPELPLFIQLDDERIEFTKVEVEGGEGANLWYRVELDRADRRAAVRALFESNHLKVSRMTQVAFGEFQLPRDLPRMRHRTLTRPQLESLYALAQIKPPADPKDESQSHERARNQKPTRIVKSGRGSRTLGSGPRASRPRPAEPRATDSRKSDSRSARSRTAEPRTTDSRSDNSRSANSQSARPQSSRSRTSKPRSASSARSSSSRGTPSGGARSKSPRR